MIESSAARRLIDDITITGRNLEQYYSVEIPFFGLQVIYQFKIWDTKLRSMSILVKEDSSLLDWIKAGDTLKMRYYSYDPIYPYQNLNSEVIDISRQGHGRLMGHYLVGLKIMERQNQDIAYWPYRPNDSQAIPFRIIPRKPVIPMID
jgi:hypothetical protein